MVFTGDHFNSPPAIDKLEETGVLSKGRAADLRNMPLQDTDLLLHEAGAPPIHTPLQVLLELPAHVKKRMYVVHTSTLPEGCELKAAPTGTAGTIRLDQFKNQGIEPHPMSPNPHMSPRAPSSEESLGNNGDEFKWQGHCEYEESAGGVVVAANSRLLASSLGTIDVKDGLKQKHRNSVFVGNNSSEAPAPLVSLRPASSTDAWFILNLLSAVPFLSR